ncbi:MAG: ABC transporter permease subunit [Treponema sp.]|nr:ABC transporter permease subunit [Treponema sp.]
MTLINSMQAAVIKKDIRGITANRRMLSVLIIVPLVMMILVPSSFILTLFLSPADSPDIAKMAGMLGAEAVYGSGGQDGMRQITFRFILDNILPLFFLIIPITSSSVMAAGAFIGEKEKKTLETLLYCPLPLKEIFTAKIAASFLVSMVTSALSFAVMITVIEAELFFTAGIFAAVGPSWLIMMLLVSPSVTLLCISLIVRGSAKSRSSEEAQQRSVFLILPIVLLITGQFTGIMLLSIHLFLAIGLALALAALLVLRGSFGKFQYENLLR